MARTKIHGNTMKLAGFIKKIILQAYQLAQQLGWLNASLYLLNRLFSIISHDRIKLYKYYLIAQPVANESLIPTSKKSNIIIREINEGDEIIQNFPRPINVIHNRFRSGAKCLVAIKDNEFIGFLWLLLDSYQEDEVRARYTPFPSKKTAWDFDVYVAPSFRLSRTFARLWSEANNMLRKRKIIWSCSRISAFNNNSLRSHKCLGAKFLGSALFVCIGTWQLSFASIYPYFHISSHDESYPEYRLNTDKPNDPRHFS